MSTTSTYIFRFNARQRLLDIESYLLYNVWFNRPHQKRGCTSTHMEQFLIPTSYAEVYSRLSVIIRAKAENTSALLLPSQPFAKVHISLVLRLMLVRTRGIEPLALTDISRIPSPLG